MAIRPDPAKVPICRKGAIPESWEPLVLPIDKAKGPTSFDIIRQLRRISTTRKIGHAGTLDPMATGLVICLSGRATKLMNHFMGQTKVYTGTIRLGETTPSFDAETEVSERHNPSSLSTRDLDEAKAQFEGDIRQTTPIYSAVKVQGERLYKKARRGESVTLPFREVSVYRFEIRERRGADLDFEIECSKGTYIRSIAHEYGQALGVGGHLAALRRTRIGNMRVDEAWTVEDLVTAYGGPA